MSPAAKLRLQRLTAFAAVLWALLALGSCGRGPAPRRARDYMPPIQTSGAGRRRVVTWVAPSAQGAGVELGDRVLAVDGAPVRDGSASAAGSDLRAGHPDGLHDRDARAGAARGRAPAGAARRDAAALVAPDLPRLVAVGVAFLGLGVLVWQLKPDREESWAFGLFCSAMAMELFCAVHTYDAWYGYERMLATLPFVGAATFHLFTTFPVRAALDRALPLRPHGAPTPWPPSRRCSPLVARSAPGVEHFGFFAYACAMLGAGVGVATLAREWLRRARHARGLADRRRVLGRRAQLRCPCSRLVSATLFFRLVLPV